MAYIGKTPSQAVRNRYFFTASGGETSISSSQISGLTFSDGAYVDVHLNGVLLVAGTDYNTNTANTIAGLSALVASDIVEIVVYDTFAVFGGTFNGTISPTGLNVGNSTAVSSIKDEDNMASNSATSLATQQSIKAYVDTQVATVPTGDITAVTAGAGLTGGGTSGAVTLDVVGGTGITANANDIAVDATVATLTGTQTLTNKSIVATQLTGTIADARFPATLPAASGVNLTALNASNLGSGTVPDARFPATLPAVSGANLTNLPATAIGGAVSSDLTFVDNRKAVFGTGSDLEVYHDGSNSYLKENGTGNLNVLGTSIEFLNSAANKYYLAMSDGGALTAYYNGGAKLATTSVGVGTDQIFGLSDTDTGIALGANGANIMQLYTANNERMRIAADGKVGIGTTSPAATLQVEASTNSPMIVKSTNGSGGYIEYQLGNSGALIGYQGNSAALVASGTAGDYAIRAQNNFVVSTNGTTQRLKIDTNGLMIFADSDTSPYNNTANSGTTIMKGELQVASVNAEGAYFNRSGSNGRVINFRRAGSFVGGINVTTSGTTYESNSDYRLKTAVSYNWDATTRLKQLKPARFKWIVDGDDAVFVDGFLAHEVQTIVPESVSGTKDAMRDEEYKVSAEEVDADGNVTKEAVMGTRSVPDLQGIDQSKLVPLLVKTIQELEARITALEAAE